LGHQRKKCKAMKRITVKSLRAKNKHERAVNKRLLEEIRVLQYGADKLTSENARLRNIKPPKQELIDLRRRIERVDREIKGWSDALEHERGRNFLLSATLDSRERFIKYELSKGLSPEKMEYLIKELIKKLTSIDIDNLIKK
jgi:FtsZ-binding cell division protein ZapB